MTDTILNYAQGRLSHEEFEAELYLRPALWEELQSLMPENAAEEDCRLWTLFPNRKLLETNQYRVKQAMLAFGYRGAWVHGMVSALVRYWDPSIEIKTPMEKSPASFLEQAGLDCIGGPEAEDYLRELMERYADCSIQEKKRLVREAFHLQPRKRPRWIQEPEWPFRNGKPLCFMAQRRNGELYEYLFRDPDTGEQVTVTQLA